MLHHTTIFRLILVPAVAICLALGARPAQGSDPVYSSEKERSEDLERKYGASYSSGRGTGRLVAGSLLLGTGIPLLLTGAVLVAKGRKMPEEYVEYIWDDYGFLDHIETTENATRNRMVGIGGAAIFFGLVQAAVGIPLLHFGLKRRSHYYEWLERQALTPTANISGRAWTVGIRLRF